ncbi:hypothetical protein LR68_01889 [Anoxybacillus sp. BCO1]|nr:hypothetical protein LR68_01889 [Anoxybacillus sp. BCO1]
MIKDQLFHLRIKKAERKSYGAIKSLLDEQLIFLDLPFTTREHVITYLAEQLYEHGYVDEMYEQKC